MDLCEEFCVSRVGEVFELILFFFVFFVILCVVVCCIVYVFFFFFPSGSSSSSSSSSLACVSLASVTSMVMIESKGSFKSLSASIGLEPASSWSCLVVSACS